MAFSLFSSEISPFKLWKNKGHNCPINFKKYFVQLIVITIKGQT